ncbi:MAG: aminopeptidase P family protein [Clostridia bacterium]|nr:aminopeptidase P family protein [Clostridia bacterium]
MKLDRLEKVIRNMRDMKLTQLLISAPASIYYLTGKWISPGERMLALRVSDSGECQLFANKLFALSPMDGIELIEYSDTEQPIDFLSEKTESGLMGVDKDWPCRFALPLSEKRSDVRLVIGSPAVDRARMLKTKEEIDLMRESSLMNDKAIGRAISAVQAGVTEHDIASAYNSAAKEFGAEGESFDSLICFGPNCAEPHHATDATLLKEGDSVILDVGAKMNGYCSDMTRTVFFGKATDEQKKVYDLVERANRAGREAVKPGVPLKDVDRAARRVIEEAGYGKYFIHRTGHGIGLEVHEFPDVSESSEAVCEPGMIFSVEPGIYLPGKFGVRVEDLVCVTEDGCETFNQFSKEMREIEC